MSRMTEAEKTLLAFIASGTIGAVSVRSGTPDAKTIEFLYARGLVEMQSICGFIIYSDTYWSLTKTGWEKGEALIKRTKR